MPGRAVDPYEAGDQRQMNCLELEAVADFGVELAGVVVVEAAEGQGIVEQHTGIADVQGVDGEGVVLAEVAAKGEIGGGMGRQVGARVGRRRVLVSVGEARAVVDVEGAEDPPWQIAVEAEVEGIPLVVVERRVDVRDVAGVGGQRRGAVAGEASCDAADLLGDLVGVGEVGLAEVPEVGRAEREFPCLDERALDGDGDEDAGFADVVVVEEVVGLGLEGVGVEQPATEGDLDAELVLFVALAFEGEVAVAIGLGVG